MQLPLFFARRYLFARRSTNAINIITGIAVSGIAIGTAALILVLSVFNGFEDLLGGLFGYFNPEIKITAVHGKTFQIDSARLNQIRQLNGVDYVSETIEEIAFFEYEGAQDFGTLKGVDQYFTHINGIDSTVREGRYLLESPDHNFALLGAGMRNKLSVNVENPLASLTIYMPLAEQSGLLDKPFKTRFAQPSGVFAIQQDFDNQYVISNLGFVREVLGVDSSTVSALEVKCSANADTKAVKQQIQAILSGDYAIKTRYEQNEAFFKVMQLEKWMGFAIASLMLLLMAFNLIGALWMIVLDKQKDISVLKSMGMRDSMVRRIFMAEGLLLTFIGMLAGFLLAIVLYIIQKKIGIITIPDGFLVNSYPISMRAFDFIPVTLTVLAIGLLAAGLPAMRAVRTPAFLREE